MSLVSKARRGIQNATWDTIYHFRQKKLPAPSMDSGFILRGLIKKGWMPCQHATTFGQHVCSGFMDLEATDTGVDIHLTARLRKGCDLKHSLALLGEMIQTYSEKHRHEVDEKALSLALFDAGFMALAHGRTPKTKAATNAARAAGLWLWDWMQANGERTFTNAIEALQAFAEPFEDAAFNEFKQGKQGRYEELRRAFFKQNHAAGMAEKDYKTLSRYYKRTEECINAGEALPIT